MTDQWDDFIFTTLPKQTSQPFMWIIYNRTKDPSLIQEVVNREKKETALCIGVFQYSFFHIARHLH